MRTLIVYASKYGTTERCLMSVADRLSEGADVIDLGSPRPGGREALADAVKAAGVVLIAGPIYAGRIRREVPRFCQRHRELLLGRRVALAISCLAQGERAREELEGAYPGWLAAHAFSRRILGGEVSVAALGRLDRFLFTRVGKSGADVSRIDMGQIEALAREIDAS